MAAIKEKKLPESELLRDLRADKKLMGDQKQEYLGMARIYLENLKKNINKTSIEMDETAPLGIDNWKNFLSYPVVRKYIQSFRDEQMTAIADSGMMQGDAKAVGMKKALSEMNPTVNNSNIVLIRLPEKIDWND
jgi:hypothetical protein